MFAAWTLTVAVKWMTDVLKGVQCEFGGTKGEQSLHHSLLLEDIVTLVKCNDGNSHGSEDT